jgi:hypothetical protein
MFLSSFLPAQQLSPKRLFTGKLKFSCILTLLLTVLLPFLANAEGFKFKVKNTTKNVVTVFYKINKRSGDFKLKSLVKLGPGEEKIKEVSISKGDTISFYGQDAEDQTSVIIKRDFVMLSKQKDMVFDIPIVIPVKESSNFESMESLSLQLEHNKVLNFLMKMDSSSMNNLSLLENNFQNVYPLGTFIFVDTKTNRLLLPPLEPSFWNNTENYFTIQDSVYALVNNNRQLQGGVQVSFIAKLFDSLKVDNAEELAFKGKLSLLRWKPSATATIYQILNDKAFESFLQNCYDQIDNPDLQYQHYRLYFLSSYERVDDLEISGKQFYTYGNEADAGLSVGDPNFTLFSTNLGTLYTKNKTLSNYYSVQNSVLRTKAYDFTSLLFNGFKNNIKEKLIDDAYHTQKRLAANILGEYMGLVDYNPDPVKLNLVKLDPKDTTAALTPVITTVSNLSPYQNEVPDTAKSAAAVTSNDKIDGFNNKVRIFNSHLKSINLLIKQLNQTNGDIIKMSESGNSNQYKYNAKNSAGLMNEIVVSNKIIQKE